MATIPRDSSLDSSFALLSEGFPFILRRSKRYQTDVFRMRLLGQKVICLHGQEGARLFYDESKFQRRGAVPTRVQKTLLGQNGIHTMDNQAHRHRKRAFMSLMTPDSIHKLMNLMAKYWQMYIGRWEKMERVVLFDQVPEIICRAACEWAGIPLQEKEVRRRSKDFVAMVDAFGAIGPRHWRGRRARKRTEQWISKIIVAIRQLRMQASNDTATYVMVWHRDHTDKLIDVHMAAVELINSVRPIVAVAWYITFGALALHKHPQYRTRLQTDDHFRELFTHEIRRYYPFGPFMGALVRSDFEWRGYQFKKGILVLLDIYGTNRDISIWKDPETFRPERFENWDGNPYNFIPQGGGDFNSGHRCPGEWITIETIKVALTFLTRHMTYKVLPEQDLSYSLSRMPTYPKSGFIITDVKAIRTPSFAAV